MKRVLTLVIVLVIVAIGVFMVMSNSSSGAKEKTEQNSATNSEMIKSSPEVKQNVKTFSVTGDHLRFFIDGVENPDIIVNEGDKVVINFRSTEGFHDWMIEEFNVATQKVSAGAASSVEFTADKKGIFEYYCSVGQHRASGMKGRFIVE
jgi:heme/copper-type cytochrome/quinol oxidase subunit 2